MHHTDSAPCVCHSVCVCKCLIYRGKLTSELDLQKKQWQERVSWKSRANCAHCLSYGGKRATAPSICLHCKGSQAASFSVQMSSDRECKILHNQMALFCIRGCGIGP